MATIVRGHSFTTHEVVEGSSLTELVSRATISDLSVDDLGSGLAWSSVYTAPSNPAYGWLTSVYEFPVLSSGPTYLDFHVLVRVPTANVAATNSSYSDVALFSPHRMETKRAVCFQGIGIPFSAGSPIWFYPEASSGATLSVLGRDAHTVGHLGVFLGTAGTGSTEPFNNNRLAFKGLVTGFLKLVISSNPSILPHYYAHQTSDNQWSYHAGTQFDPVFLFSMTNKWDTAYNLREPVYLFGGPMWRS